jgi:hypothetical protein
MVEAAIWLRVQGDRAGAEELLVQALRIDPTHERAREAMKSMGAATRPGRDPALERPTTQPGSPPLDGGRTPLEPHPALQRGPPPGAFPPPRSTFPHGAPVSGELPFSTTPSALRSETERRDERTDLHAAPRSLESSTQPRLDVRSVAGKSWSLEVLTGPHTGTSVPMTKRPLLIGRGLGVLDVESDFFMSPGHASFFQRGGDLWIGDGGSESGTWLSIDGPTRLNPGDSFSVGLQRLRYLGPLDSATATTPWPYGAPRPASTWRLEHVLVGNRPGRTWLLRGMITLGQSAATITFPDDELLAPVQAELRPAGAAIELIDRSGRGATFVMVPPNGERRLLEGMQVRLGSTVFRVTSR